MREERRTLKEKLLIRNLGHRVNNHMTVIWRRWGAIAKEIYLRPPLDFYISRMVGEFLFAAAQICSCVSLPFFFCRIRQHYIHGNFHQAGRKAPPINAVQCVNKEHMAIFTGAGVAIITPFSGTEVSITKSSRWHIEAQIAGRHGCPSLYAGLQAGFR